MRVIDFRSDTVTQPTLEMREAMAGAELGDDVKGEDPTVNRLEAMAAEIFHKEASLLVTSGTMGNLLSVLAQCQRGDEVIVGDKSHMARAEAGGVSVLGGVAIQPIHSDDNGIIDLEAIEASIRPNDFHYARTRLLALENTHGTRGAVLTPEYMDAVGQVARTNGLSLHVDGARIFNASVYLETPVAELSKDADTITFCLSKGLSAPVGSVICGDRETIDKARRLRKMIGAGMRQAGIIAAAGVVALETMVDRLAEDHANARKLARGLSEIPGVSIDPDNLPTNLIFFTVTNDSLLKLTRGLEEHGIKMDPERPVLRLVVHYGITSDDIDYTLEVFESIFAQHVAV